MGLFWGWDGVISVAAPGVAAEESAECEVCAFDEAVLYQGFFCVVGASWKIAARVGESEKSLDGVSKASVKGEEVVQ